MCSKDRSRQVRQLQWTVVFANVRTALSVTTRKATAPTAGHVELPFQTTADVLNKGRRLIWREYVQSLLSITYQAQNKYIISYMKKDVPVLRQRFV
jgi:hypothetical protein